MDTRPTIDELLDGAVSAMNRGDRATADALAGQVLAVDGSNPDAEELLSAPSDTNKRKRRSCGLDGVYPTTNLL